MVKTDMNNNRMEWSMHSTQSQPESRGQKSGRIHSYPPSMTIPRPLLWRSGGDHKSQPQPVTPPSTLPPGRDAGKSKGELVRPTTLQLGKDIGKQSNGFLSRADASRHSTGSIATGKKELSIFSKPKPVTPKATALKPILKSGKGSHDHDSSESESSCTTASDVYKRRLAKLLESRLKVKQQSKPAISPTTGARKSVTFEDEIQAPSGPSKHIRKQTRLPFVSLANNDKHFYKSEGHQIFV